jgi:hypothetical protein
LENGARSSQQVETNYNAESYYWLTFYEDAKTSQSGLCVVLLLLCKLIHFNLSSKKKTKKTSQPTHAALIAEKSFQRTQMLHIKHNLRHTQSWQARQQKWTNDSEAPEVRLLGKAL